MNQESLQGLILKLATAEETVRRAAAREVFASGKCLAESAIAPWMQIPELSSLLNGPQLHPTVGVAVKPELFAQIRAANGAPPLATVPPDQDAEEFEIHFEPDVSLDILTTKQPGGSGAIARYLARFGEGIQQVEFRCTVVDRAVEILRQQLDLMAVYPEPRLGANGARINFFLVPVPQGGKILIELYQPATGS